MFVESNSSSLNEGILSEKKKQQQPIDKKKKREH